MTDAFDLDIRETDWIDRLYRHICQTDLTETLADRLHRHIAQTDWTVEICSTELTDRVDRQNSQKHGTDGFDKFDRQN